MKPIFLSNEDYELLMALSKELQTQPYHVQAAPRYWEPSSEKLEPNFNDEGEIIQIFDHGRCENYTPEEYAEAAQAEYDKFMKEQTECLGIKDQSYLGEYEEEWIEYIRDNIDNARVYSSDWTRKTEHNPSLFLSDVQGYIEANKHHLGRNPQTYANTIWRMPKMEALVDLICRINPPATVEKTEVPK